MTKNTDSKAGDDHTSTEVHKQSNVNDLLLPENVAGGRGAHTTVSILEPVMRIERLGDRIGLDGQPLEEYHIILNFKLQVKIHAFEKGYRKKHDQLFDFMPLRYLYRHTDQFRHEVIPGADPVTILKATDETTRSNAVDAGISGNPVGGGPTLNLNYHVDRDNKLSYEKNEANAWKRGLSYESYSPIPHHSEHGYSGHTQVGDRYRHHHHSFQVHSKHWKKCKSPLGEEEYCPHKTPDGSRKPGYDRCVHWFWQTEASAHLWTPEIYDSYTQPITVRRIVSTRKFDKARNEGDGGSKLGCILTMAIPYLHFDFVVSTRLRELGHLTTADGVWSMLKNTFRIRSQPAEVKAKRDFGYPLSRDRVTFCVWACAARIKWPRRETQDSQKTAADAIRKAGYPIDRIPNAKENLDQRRKKEKEQHKKKHTTESSLYRRGAIPV